MSVQLILFPQSYDGSTSMAGPGPEMLLDGYSFTTINSSPNSINVTGTLPQDYILANTFNINTWYRFSSDANAFTTTGSTLVGVNNCSLVQRLSNLTVGLQYNLIIDFGVNVSGFDFYHYSGTTQVSVTNIPPSGVLQVLTTFTPQTSTDTLVFVAIGAQLIRSISVKRSSLSLSSLSNGQVICDLYEDEDIPLTLSVDDFKNVAEQVHAYSKAFNLPATKRNNKIFDNLFEITRSDDGVAFNPYVKTQCQLKQDGFLLFEGYLQLLDIQDKEGEISYNINIFSEVIALADILKERTFSDLSFSELDHIYNKTNIKNSWNSAGTGIAYTNTPTSGFRDANDTLKYPFIDWTHQWVIATTGGTPTAGFPQLTSFEQAFRPCIQIKYLIDRIFNQTSFNFSYTSDFFNTPDFKNLYMDFNWGGNEMPVPDNSYYSTWNFGTGATSNIGNGSFKELRLIPDGVTGGESNSTVPPNYDTSTYIITATTDNEIYKVNYTFRIHNTDASGQNTASLQWVHNGNTIDVNSGVIIGALTSYYYSGSFTRSLNAGDTLKAQFQGGLDIYQDQGASSLVTFNVSTTTVSSATLNALRGELGQWEFLKGIITMFNLVSMPDASNQNNILIEPYSDVFLNNSESKQLNWTDKIDVTEIKLNPLTDLNRNTIFKFIEDEDDYAFMNYKQAVQGHLYGSKKFDASTSTSGLETILQGLKEVIAEPFAATVPKPLTDQFTDLITPAIYSYNADDDTSEGFDNSPRIMYNNGIKSSAAGTFTSCTYFIPGQNGTFSENADAFLQFSHLSAIPTVVSNPSLATDTRDFHFGECQLIQPIGNATPNNLFNIYWLPYFNELYNPDARTMTIKVNLSAGDINTFRFYDTVIIKNREFRVNKIDYKPNDLATIEFILIT
tara:strand:+ start:959 stop:3652 length:2694 start_codon:yes stop_codon:yes gene_type:complete